MQNYTCVTKVIVRDRAEILHSISVTSAEGLNITRNKFLTSL